MLLLLSGVLETRAQTVAFRENLLFTTILAGNQVVPGVSSVATGIGSFMLNKKRDSISVNISFVGLTPTSAGIYVGEAGANGTLLFDLSGNISGGQISKKLSGTDVVSNISKILGDGLYLQIGSAANPTGEIRGQITLATDWNFVAELTGQEAVPTTSSFGYGLGSFALSRDKDELSFKIICQELSGSITDAKLHIGAAGVVGAEIATLSDFIDGNVIIGSIAPSAALLSALFEHEIYLNIQTNAFLDGEVRSQLLHKKGLSLEVFADAEQMVPPTSSNGKALGVFRLSPSLDTLTYHIVATDMTSAIEYNHFHVANVGQPYGALQLDFTPSISGNQIKGQLLGTTVSSIAINKLLVSNLALVFHTVNYPTGEIRGQSVRFAHEGFTFQIAGEQQVPAVESNAYGSGFVSISRNLDRAHYAWVAGGFSSIANGAQFHHAATGENGPVIYDMGNTITTSGTQATAAGVWKNSDTQAFLPEHATQFMQNQVYLTVSTASNPDGEVRGQVLGSTVFYPETITSTVDFVGDELLFTVSPNPANSTLRVLSNSIFSRDAQLRIVDVLGRTVLHVVSIPQSGLLDTQIDISSLNAGMYVLVLTSGQASVSGTLIKG